MVGTAVAQLESKVSEFLAEVRELEGQDVSRSEGTEALLVLERTRELVEVAVGGLATDLEARGAHEYDSAPNMAVWLAARTGERRATTGGRLHLARKLRSMPATTAALETGAITHSHARVLARALNSRTAAAFAEDEAMLVGHAGRLTADQLVQVVEFWLTRHDPDGPEPAPEHRDRFHLSETLDGRVKGNFDLGGDRAIAVKAVIDELVEQLLWEDQDNREVDPTDPGLDDRPSERRARALAELCERAAASPENPARRQPLLNLHTTVETLAGAGEPEEWMAALEQAWSSAIPLDTMALWACDCWIAEVVIRKADGEVLDAGRERRTANRAMRRALVARDGHHCAVPGCGRPIGWCDAHHIIWWIHGGHTKVENLVFVCRWHHTRIHTGALHVELVENRPRFTNRDGLVLVEPRAGPAPPSNGSDPPGGDPPPQARAA